jgi:thiopeptide-type bacteriocin biosynthesis protein
VIPFIKLKAAPRPAKTPLRIESKPKVTRKFYPGSEWLYFKLYLNPESIPKVLESAYKFYLKESRRKNIRKWFFINYADPKPHIRVRFEMNSNQLAEGAIASVFSHLDPFLKNGEIHDIVIAPYIRELERYGAETMDICEEIFAWSSNLVCRNLSQPLNDRQSILFNCKIAMLLLKVDKDAIPHLNDLCKSTYDRFSREFNLDQKRSIRDFFIQEYREISKDIQSAFMEISQAGSQQYSFLEPEDYRIETLVTRLYDFKASFAGDFDEIIRSVVHMHFNRAYSKNQRFEEMKAYCYLAKHFSSELARTEILQR